MQVLLVWILSGSIAALGGGTIAASTWNWLMARSSRSWPSVMGRITASGFSDVKDKHGRTVSYKIELTYVYEVNAVEYQSRRHRFGSARVGWEEAGDFVDAHPPGTPVKVHYRPANPATATLDTELPTSHLVHRVFIGAITFAPLIWLLFSQITG